jgi:hypothetical protein
MIREIIQDDNERILEKKIARHKGKWRDTILLERRSKVIGL